MQVYKCAYAGGCVKRDGPTNVCLAQDNNWRKYCAKDHRGWCRVLAEDDGVYKYSKYREKSKEWADHLDGKKVIVFFEPSVHQSNANTLDDHNIVGTAKRIRPELKWGRIRVYLDPEEYPRIVNRTPWIPEAANSPRTTFSVDAPFGLQVEAEPSKDGGRWYTDIIWSYRESIREWEAFKGVYARRRLQEVGVT